MACWLPSLTETPMLIPYAQVYTSTFAGAVVRLVKCESCAIDYGYVLRRKVSSSSTSWLFLDNEGAAQRASTAAEQDLRRELEIGSDFVPCPRCGWCQLDMLSAARGRSLMILKVLGIALMIAAFCLFFLGTAGDSLKVLRVSLTLGVLAAMMPLVRLLIVSMQSPNAKGRVSRRCASGSPHAFWGAALDPERAESICPSCKCARERKTSHCLNCAAPLSDPALTLAQKKGPPHAAAWHWLAVLGLLAAMFAYMIGLALDPNFGR